MLEHGMAKPSSSAWSSPCLLVKIPDFTLRPCIDFCKVNAVIKPGAYPLPRTEDCVDHVGAAKTLSPESLWAGSSS